MLRAGLKFLIKDALRGARHGVRQASSIEPPIDFPGRRHLTGLADSVLTSLEETVVTIRYGSDLSDDMIRLALPELARLKEMIGLRDFHSRFASAAYRLSKAILARRGLDRLLMSELAYASAAQAIAARAVTKGWSAEQFAAEVSLALIAAAPIKDVSEDNPGVGDDLFRRDPNTAAALALGLTVAAWLAKGDPENTVEYVTSASDLVAAAETRLTGCLAAPDRAFALALAYSEMATFVP